jgi:hypothetical protein
VWRVSALIANFSAVQCHQIACQILSFIHFNLDGKGAHFLTLMADIIRHIVFLSTILIKGAIQLWGERPRGGE